MILEIFSPEALISFMDWTLSSRLWLVSSTRCAASVISPDTLRVFSAWRRVIAAVSVAEDEVSSSVAGAFQDIADSCRDRKSTRLNSSHLGISYAVFCLQ